METIDTIKNEVDLSHLPAPIAAQLQKILFRNWDIFSRDKYDLGRTSAYEHDVLLTSDQILFKKQFRIPQEHVTYIQNHTQELLKLGAIKRSTSRYNAPIFCVPKPKGRGLRVVIDYRDLNRISKPDYYVSKTVDDCIDIIGQAKSTMFSSLDLTSGFHQMPLAESAQHLTAFSVPGMGSFEWTTSPFGLLGCPASFSRLMDIVMQDLNNVICYLDDTLVHSDRIDTHFSSLQKVFDRLRTHNLKLNPSKCEFLKRKIPYLGFMLSPQGITPDVDKIRAIANLPPPDTQKKIMSFIGMANYFRRHIKGFTFLAQELTALTKKNSQWQKGELPPRALHAFNKLKTALTSAPVMAYPDPAKPFLLTTDAATGDKNGNPGGLGAYLSQMDANNVERVIAYASRPLLDHEKNYPPYLLEMQAAVYGIEHFYVYLTNRKFTLFTDHKPLVKLSTAHTKTLNRLQLLLLEHNFTLKYRPGSSNTVSDFCSRSAAYAAPVQSSLDAPASLLAMRNEDIHKLQLLDDDLRALFQFMYHGQPPPKHLDRFVQFHAPYTVLHNKILYIDFNGNPVMFLPSALRDDVLQAAHNSNFGGHFALHKTVRLIKDNYYFPRMFAAIEQHIKACIPCQKAKAISKPHSSELIPLPQEDGPNFRVHVDLYGPMKSESGDKYVCVMTDAFTKYVELAAIPDKKAETVARCIYVNWICRHSVPALIVSDGGREFCNSVLTELLMSFGSEHVKTSPYHPQCNAQAEQFNRTMTRYLRQFTDASTLDWPKFLPALMFSYNTAIHKATQSSPFRLLYNYSPRMPYFDADAPRRIFYGDLPPQDAAAQMRKARAAARACNMAFRDAYTHLYNRKKETPQFLIGEQVLLHAPHLTSPAVNFKLANPWVGPFTIEKVFDNHNVLIKNNSNNKQCFRVHFDRVKKVRIDTRNVIPPRPIEGNHNTDSLPRLSTDEKANAHFATSTGARSLNDQRFPATRVIEDTDYPSSDQEQTPQARSPSLEAQPPQAEVRHPTSKRPSLIRSITKRVTRATSNLLGKPVPLTIPKRPLEYKPFPKRSATQNPPLPQLEPRPGTSHHEERSPATPTGQTGDLGPPSTGSQPPSPPPPCPASDSPPSPPVPPSPADALSAQSAAPATPPGDTG